MCHGVTRHVHVEGDSTAVETRLVDWLPQHRGETKKVVTLTQASKHCFTFAMPMQGRFPRDFHLLNLITVDRTNQGKPISWSLVTRSTKYDWTTWMAEIQRSLILHHRTLSWAVYGYRTPAKCVCVGVCVCVRFCVCVFCGACLNFLITGQRTSVLVFFPSSLVTFESVFSYNRSRTTKQNKKYNKEHYGWRL